MGEWKKAREIGQFKSGKNGSAANVDLRQIGQLEREGYSIEEEDSFHLADGDCCYCLSLLLLPSSIITCINACVCVCALCLAGSSNPSKLFSENNIIAFVVGPTNGSGWWLVGLMWCWPKLTNLTDG